MEYVQPVSRLEDVARKYWVDALIALLAVAGALELVVADRGPAPGRRHGDTAELPSGGHGIVGMRERVRVYGGELTANPRPDGGFVVRARIPAGEGEMVPA